MPRSRWRAFRRASSSIGKAIWYRRPSTCAPNASSWKCLRPPAWNSQRFREIVSRCTTAAIRSCPPDYGKKVSFTLYAPHGPPSARIARDTASPELPACNKPMPHLSPGPPSIDHMAYQLTVNGRKHRVSAPPEIPLLWVLRDFLNLTGTKYGCGAGVCGACTIHQDHVAVDR